MRNEGGYGLNFSRCVCVSESGCFGNIAGNGDGMWLGGDI